MIVAEPPTPPVTRPVPEPTVAMEVLLVLHVPPALESLSEIPEPEQTVEGPDIGVGGASTVILAVVAAPHPVE